MASKKSFNFLTKNQFLLIPLFISIILFTNLAFSEKTPWQKKFDNYTKDLPKEVIELLMRMDGCEHFGGEEPYDEVRAKEIAAAVKKLKCEDLDKDKKLLLKKYKKQPKVISKIKKFPSAVE